VIDGWPGSSAGLAATLPADLLLGLEARVDSALLWALVRHRLRLGVPAADALSDTVATLDAAGVTGRFNFLLTDGRLIAATAAGDTLYYRTGQRADVIVASEPGDDEPGWTEVPGNSVVTASPHQILVTELDRPTTQRHESTENPKVIDGRIPTR
jgi:glutamine amidotransferase